MSQRARRISGIGLTLALLLAGAAWLVATSADGKQPRKPVRAGAFRSCDGLVGYARSHGLEIVEARERMRERLANTPPVAVSPLALGAPQADAKAVPVSQEGIDHSTTNVQEAGVDEPDIVKTDGAWIFAVAGQKLHAVDSTGGSPRLVDSLALEGSNHELLLRGERLLVVSTLHSVGEGPVALPAGRGARAASYWPADEETLVSEVNVRNPAAMRVTRTLRIGGSYVSSRQNGGTARLVIGSHPRALDPVPEPAREQVERAGAGNWLPSYVFRNRRTGRTAKHRLVRCRSVRHAPAFSGLDLLTVLTIDLDKGLPAIDSDALMTDADTVYASTRSLYVTSEKWLPEDFAGPFRRGRGPRSTSSTSTSPTGPSIAPVARCLDTCSTSFRSPSTAASFELRARSSRRGGRATARGRARASSPCWTSAAASWCRWARSEAWAAVSRSTRCVSSSDNGFVVTFRQTDPLYTIDLSSPERPRVLGELKIRGYSAYLHPVGKDLLIGVGQDATDQGRVLGTQISLFDVSDLRRPIRLHQQTIAGDSSSEVEYDHHAFLYWPPTKLTLMPVTVYGRGPTWGPVFGGAVGFRVGREGIDEVGKVGHEKLLQASPDAARRDHQAQASSWAAACTRSRTAASR